MEVSHFYWYVSEGDILEDGTLDFSLSAGRLRHRWVPLDRQSASLYLKESDEAETPFKTVEN